MPHSLTSRQREYLEFIREYIKTNESSPRLEEIAKHFGVKSPTAHKTLKGLMNSGYIIFGRTKKAGFFIRLIERAGTAETVYEVPVVGKIDGLGMLHDFPIFVDHFPAVLPGIVPENISAFIVTQDIPEANILSQDLLICDLGKRPQPGDLAILPFGLQSNQFVLCNIHKLTADKNMPNLEVANDFPLPEIMIDKELGQKLYWSPIAFSEDTKDYYFDLMEKANVPLGPIPPELIMATVLRLSRNLAF
jgi:SOS-response transcriptional repressor LexA